MRLSPLTATHRLSVAVSSLLIGWVTPVPSQDIATLQLTREWRVRGATHDLLPTGGIAGLLAVSQSGVVALAQRDDHRVVFIDARGRITGHYGREGSGPGEISNLFSVGWQADTAWILTGPLGAGQSLVFIAPDGELLRQVRTPDRFVMPQGSRAVTGFSPIVRAVLGEGGLVAVAVHGRGSPPPWADGEALEISLLRISFDGGVIAVLGSESSVDCAVSTGNGRNVRLPFCSAARSATSPAGRFTASTRVIGEEGPTRRVRVTLRRSDGALAWEREYRIAAERIPESVLEQRVERIATSARAAAELRRAGVPTYYPVATGVIVSDDGTTAIRMGTAPEDPRWLVVAPDGSVWGQLVLRGGMHPMVLRGDRLWMVEVDDDGLEDIVQYRFRRR